MTLSTPKKPTYAAAAPVAKNTNRVFRVVDRLRAYRRLGLHALRCGVSPSNLLRTQFPFLLPDARKPPIVTVELTNICNLKCTYCTSPLGLRPRGYMSDETFNALERSLADMKVERVRVVGNGESTLHPRFQDYVTRLAAAVPHVSVLSNGNWKRERVGHTMLDANVRLMEFSADGGDAEAYERSRVGGDFERFVRNLRALRKERDRRRARSLILVRLMVRPSELARKADLMRFWREIADTVFVQYIRYRKNLEYGDDVFPLGENADDDYPKCTLPFKDLGVEWTGAVPLCSGSESQLGPPGLILGNVNETPLAELWNGPVMSSYRCGHRNRDLEKIAICRGCGQGV